MSRRNYKSMPFPAGPQKDVVHGDSKSNSHAFDSPPLVLACAIAIWFARWVIPAESSTMGETLWIVVLWIILALVYVYSKYRERIALEKITPWEIGLGVVVLGQCLGCAGVWMNGGNLRSAVNGCWEWIGVGLSTSMMLRLLNTSLLRARFITVLMTFLVILSGLGIWQHYVWYPKTAAHFRELLSSLEEDIKPARRYDIEKELAQAGYPDNRQAQLMFEQRLFSSTEPIAFFALTNSLAGLLAVGTIIGLFGLIRLIPLNDLGGEQSRRNSQWFAIVCGTATIVFCLLLTKSRTAWVGTALAIVIGCLLLSRQLHISRKIWLRGGMVFMAVVVLVTGVLALSGGLDWQVLSEAPKSLKYRLEYWSGTWQVIKAHPMTGVGPGNFRQHYLQFKLPESSEEIADPHQMVLDLWVQGGVVSLLGLGVLLLIVVRGLRKPHAVAEDSGKQPSAIIRFDSPWILAGIGSFLLVYLVQFLCGERFDQRLFACGLSFWILLPFGLRSNSASFTSPMALGLATLALVIHLQGAGGASMPAVAQILFLLPALAVPVSTQVQTSAMEPVSSSGNFRTMFLLFALLMSCLFTAFLPAWQCRTLLLQGDSVLMSGQSPRIAENYYRRAADADDWNPDPYERLAQVSFLVWSVSRDASSADFAQGVTFQKEAIRRNPFDHKGYQILGQWFSRRFERTKTADDAATAADMFVEAVRRYPEDSELQWELAIASRAAGQTEQARRAAKRAIELDEINRRYSHSDKYLTSDQLSGVRAVLNDSVVP
ncbi:MAG: O-antigen ligase family protein [Planctomycetota bacterium]|nr:O-antigen ligase family protein [Planctomycetota bacterium]